MTNSAVFPDPNLIIEGNPLSFPALTVLLFNGAFVALNYKPVVVLPPSLINYIPADKRVYVTADDGTVLGVKVNSLERPIQPRWILVTNPNARQLNRPHVFHQVDPSGVIRTYEQAKITAHGTAGFAELVRLVALIDSPDCNLLFRIIRNQTPRHAYSIPLGNREFTDRFTLLTLGNHRLSQRNNRRERKFQWFEMIAELNYTLGLLEYINVFIEDGYGFGYPIGEDVYTFQELLAQLVKNNIHETVEMTLALCKDGQPSGNPRYTPTDQALRYMETGQHRN